MGNEHISNMVARSKILEHMGELVIDKRPQPYRRLCEDIGK